MSRSSPFHSRGILQRSERMKRYKAVEIGDDCLKFDIRFDTKGRERDVKSPRFQTFFDIQRLQGPPEAPRRRLPEIRGGLANFRKARTAKRRDSSSRSFQPSKSESLSGRNEEGRRNGRINKRRAIKRRKQTGPLVADSRDERITRRLDSSGKVSLWRVSAQGMRTEGGGGRDGVAFQYLRAEIFTKSHRGRRIRGGGRDDLPDAAGNSGGRGRAPVSIRMTRRDASRGSFARKLYTSRDVGVVNI